MFSFFKVVGAKKFHFQQMKCILGRGSKLKFDDVLDARSKGYWWRFKESTIFYALSLDWD